MSSGVEQGSIMGRGYFQARKQRNVDREKLAQKIRAAGSRKEKGLKYFSGKVMARLEEREESSFAEIASDLVQDQDIESKELNLRRRVYDCLNILIGLGAVQKLAKRRIRWVGLPKAHSPEMRLQLAEKMEQRRRVKEKRILLEQIRGQYESVHNLIHGNMSRNVLVKPNECLYLPFLLFSCPSDSPLDVEISTLRDQVVFSSLSPPCLQEHLSL